MKSVLLINTDTCPYALVYPIGLDYLSSVLQNNGYRVDSLDLAFIPQKDWLSAVSLKFKSNNYPAIGIGIRNLYDEIYGGRNYLPEIFAFVRSVKKIIKKKRIDTKIILGGSGFSLMPDTILDETGADCGIINEGESALITVLKKIENAQRLSQRIYYAPNDLSKINYQRGSWGNFHGYFQQGTSGNLQTKRGCPMKCLYCEYPAIEGSRFRFRDPEIIASEFIQLENLGFPRIYIVDATFNNPLPQAIKILKALKEAKTKKEWTAFFNPKFIAQELLELVKATNGGKPLKITIESGSNLMLATLQKNFNRDDIFRAANLCRENRIDFSFTVLLGGPGENHKTVKETCDVIKKCKPVYVSMNIGIFLHPKTQIAERVKGDLWKSEEDFIKPIIYPCERNQIKSWIEEGLSSSGVPYNIYSGGED